MFVAASALKIATCWINQFDELLQSKDGLKIKKQLGIPEDHRVVGSCILGYPKEGTVLAVKERKADFIKII
jgi:nitroreductase